MLIVGSANDLIVDQQVVVTFLEQMPTTETCKAMGVINDPEHAVDVVRRLQC